MRVVVIGSGIAGASAAYQLTRRDVEVVVVDAGRSGVATAAGAGIVCPWTSRGPEEHNRAASVAADYYRTLVAELADDGVTGSSFEVVGGMVVSADPGELDEAHERVSRRAAASAVAGEVRRLDRARELFPALAPELGAVYVAGGARVDGRQLREALLTAAAKRGAEVVTGEARFTGGDVHVNGATVAADKIVVAAGAWSADLVEPLGVSLGVAPQRGQISHFELPGVDTGPWPVVLPVSSHYLLAFPGSRVVAGATRETGSGFDYRITAAGQREVLENALAVAPGLADATLLETRVGFRPASEDGLPLLGPLTERPDVLIATGFGPSGLTLAPFAGRLIAELALGARPSLDLEPYRPERFSAR
ncbi:NAD(P)/FAD-dependent oxidoreductase [Amycolatopsis alkalitolerans]|uniref:FAD-binding oxidoreductase n=1 Tax=Amycolatopsis alkalitolerans TaxID=2547244 RepID=A0A5C4M0G1_9PSEU|nr:FAD-binding oxidoreductase [Amycolatopsis alkalitolerans]TNC24304.1 FAD-binding oxidoreductase [Amycolatopsis alkalitolerans]